jgi:hypothetical protein
MSDAAASKDVPSCPEVLNELITTSVMRARTGGPSYVVVNLDERIGNVSYKVYPTVSDADPVSGICFGGELREKVPGFNHSFVFPVEKKMLYFVVLTCDVHVGWEDKQVNVTWLMDPFKRRPVSREEVAPSTEGSPDKKKLKK